MALVCFQQAAGQVLKLNPNLRFENFNAKNNFINNFVGNVTVDQQGYLWAASDALFRFDGVSLTKFTSYNNQRHGLKANYSDDLLPDAFGRLWVGNIAGLCYYESNSNQFHYIEKIGSDPIQYAFAYCIVDNHLWFVCNLGLCRINLHTLQLTRTSLVNLFDPLFTKQVDSNRLFISTRENYFIYDTRTDSFIKRSLEYANKKVRFTDLVKKDETYWLATNRGLYTSKNPGESFEFITGTENINTNSMLLHPADSSKIYLWLATLDGLKLFNINSKKTDYEYKYNPDDPYSIQSNSLTGLYADSQKRLWISTEKGVSLFDYKYQALKTHFLNFPGKNGDDYIRCIKEDKYDSNKLWISAQYGGILLYDWRDKHLIKQDKLNNYPSLQAPDVLDMVQIDEKNWILLAHNQVSTWNSKTGTQSEKIRINVPGTPVPSLQAYKLIDAGTKGIFIITTRGLFHYKPGSATISNLLLRKENDQYISSLDLVNAAFDGEQFLWIASRKGLLRYDVNLNSTEYYFLRNDADTIKTNFLEDLTIFNNNIYCATHTGLLIFNSRSKQFEKIQNFDNIHNPVCYTLLMNNGLLWINSNAGLIIYNPVNKKSRIYSLNSTHTPFSSVSALSAFGQFIIIPFRDAYSYFNPQLLLQSSLPSVPVIESIFVNNQPYKTTNSEVSLSYRQNNIRFLFTAFNYNDPGKIRFRYKLQGVDKEWIYTSGERNANYMQLPPGKFAFIVQAGNEDGSWNEQSAIFNFRVKAAFWQTPLFKLLLLLIILSLPVLYYTRRVNSIRRKAALKQLIAETEMKALRAQMNPHFIFNCMATIDGFILQNKKLDASEFLGKFSRLIRMVLENSQHALIPLSSDLNALKLYIELEQTRQANKFNYTIHADDDLDPGMINVPPLLLQPYVENAIMHGLRHKHSNDGFLKITLALENDSLVCTIEDNGIGRSKAALLNQHQNISHRSMGTAVTLNRIETVQAIYHKKASVHITDKADHSGTLVVIILPVFKNFV